MPGTLSHFRILALLHFRHFVFSHSVTLEFSVVAILLFGILALWPSRIVTLSHFRIFALLHFRIFVFSHGRVGRRGARSGALSRRIPHPRGAVAVGRSVVRAYAIPGGRSGETVPRTPILRAQIASGMSNAGLEYEPGTSARLAAQTWRTVPRGC